MKKSFNALSAFLISLILVGFTLPVWAAENNANVVSPFPVTLTLEQAQRDNRGTDVSQVKDITVNFDGEAYKTNSKYNILVYIDGEAAWEFPDKGLPFSFKWNFRGLTNGSHTMKIQVEDKVNRVVLAEEEESVDVVRPERRQNWTDAK